MAADNLELAGAVHYHYGRFPPASLNFEQLAPALAAASAALARYDVLLKTLHSSEVLLAPLRRREAVISSRIEGTVATLDEVLRLEAEEAEDDDPHSRAEVLEVFSYTRAMNAAQRQMADGLPLSGRLLKSAHSHLLFFGRGADKQPGQFKSQQNYIADKDRKRILFVPANVEKFDDLFRAFENYINVENQIPILQTAIAHAEFESLHPFKDGNGRLGRMLITLMLWNKGLISAPHFYVSGCIEHMRDEYIDRLRAVSANDEWTEWCGFFLQVITRQAEENVQVAESIRDLYEEMKEVFRKTTSSQWAIAALDFVFAKPIFRNSAFTGQAGIRRQTAHRITSELARHGLLSVVEPSSGRRSALYAFEPLLKLTRA